MTEAELNMGKWMSAALEDPNVCDEMKADIRAWFAHHVAKHTFTCIGKGGLYEWLGPATGAGKSRGKAVIVYRDVETGNLYFRSNMDFNERMQKLS